MDVHIRCQVCNVVKKYCGFEIGSLYFAQIKFIDQLDYHRLVFTVYIEEIVYMSLVVEDMN